VDDLRVDMIQPWDLVPSGGGDVVSSNGADHVENWGDPGTSLTTTVRPSWTGRTLIELHYANGAGPISTGNDCGVKRLTVTRLSDGAVTATGYLVAPQTGGWSVFEDSSALPVDLDARETYALVLDDDPFATNMSELALNGPAFTRLDVAGVKLLAMTGGADPTIPLGGDHDHDLFPAADQAVPGVTIQSWDAFALALDADFLYVAVVSSAFQTTTDHPSMIYLQADPATTGTRPGLTYLAQTATVPFPADHVITLRRQTDVGDGTGPWNGVFAWTGASWVRTRRLAQGHDFWVSSDDATLSARIPRSQLGAPSSTIRLAAHVVAGGGNYDDTVPSTHAPWTSQTTGYVEIDLSTGAWTVK
jgi:hypothetical protein